jgi:hypothetical protein
MGYSENNLRRAVNKTSNLKKVLYTKNIYTLKLLLNIVTAGIEALVILENKFLYACVKESMLGGSLVTMAWRILRLQMEMASRYGG